MSYRRMIGWNAGGGVVPPVGLDTLWGAGFNADGQLGLGGVTFVNVFTQIDTDSWAKVAGGQGHTLAIKSDGTLWVCGQNNYGQLGLGDNNDRTTLTPVGFGTWTDVVGGGFHSIALRSDGTLWTCGYNAYGQLGLGDTINRNLWTQVGTETWIEIGSCYDGTFAIKSDNTLWGCGLNTGGSLGVGDNTNRDVLTQESSASSWKKVSSSGIGHVLAIKSDNTLWSCGDDVYGALGLGSSTLEVNVFTQVATPSTADMVACGFNHSLARAVSGYLYVFGGNGNGQLGLGDNTDRYVPTITSFNATVSIGAGYYHSLVVASDKSLWSCGSNGVGQLGLGDTTDRDTFTQVGTETVWKRVPINAGFHSIAIKGA